MQNSQPYLRFARKALRQGARKSPRASRRGALMPAALLAVLLITVLLSQFAGAQLRQASAARSEARAVQLAAIAADFDYYVHEKRSELANGLTQAASSGRPLTTAEQMAFEDNYLRADVARQMPGFTLTYLVGRIADGREVFGGLLLSTSGTNSVSEPEMAALMARLARYGAQDHVLDHDSFAQNVLGRALSGAERLILTAPLSGLDTRYVLRTRRAGHAAPKLVGSGAFDLNGHNLVNVGILTATGGGDSAATRVVGTLRTPELAGTLTSLRPTATSTATAGLARRPESGGSATASGQVEGGNVDIAGTTRVTDPNAGTDPNDPNGGPGGTGGTGPNAGTGSFTVQRSLTAGGMRLLSRRSAEAGDATIGRLMTVSRHLQTGTLTTPGLRAASLATPRITISRLINAQNLVAKTLRTPALSNIRPTTTLSATRGPGLTARQVFTERATIRGRLQTEGCTGC